MFHVDPNGRKRKRKRKRKRSCFTSARLGSGSAATAAPPAGHRWAPRRRHWGRQGMPATPAEWLHAPLRRQGQSRQVPWPPWRSSTPLPRWRSMPLNLLRARRRAAAGPSGATCEHTRAQLGDENCCDFLHSAAQCPARAEVPEQMQPGFALAVVALQKFGGGIGAVVMGDVFRRTVSRTLAQQLRTQPHKACAPFQFSPWPPEQVRKRWHVHSASLQSPIHIRPWSALTGLKRTPRLPSPSATHPSRPHVLWGGTVKCLFYDESGHAHIISQAEGGKKRDCPPSVADRLLTVHSALRSGEDLYDL